jgi:hypothetical protein
VFFISRRSGKLVRDRGSIQPVNRIHIEPLKLIRWICAACAQQRILIEKAFITTVFQGKHHRLETFVSSLRPLFFTWAILLSEFENLLAYSVEQVVAAGLLPFHADVSDIFVILAFLLYPALAARRMINRPHLFISAKAKPEEATLTGCNASDGNGQIL